MGKKDARVSIEPIIVEKNIVTSEAAEEPIKEQFVEEKLEEEVSKPIETTDTPSQLVELNEDEAVKELALYLTNITNDMGVPALVKIQHEASGLIVMNLETSKQGMLIGKHGKIECFAVFSSSLLTSRCKRKIISSSKCWKLSTKT